MKKIGCDCNIIHADQVKVVLDNVAESDNANAVKIFKALGDETRMSIVSCLLYGELCVCDIAYITNMTKSAISHQLSVLKKVNIVKSDKRGKEVFYTLDDQHIVNIVSTVLQHTKHKVFED